MVSHDVAYAFSFLCFLVNMPAAQVVWDYCQRQFISRLSGKMLEVASDGALVLISISTLILLDWKRRFWAS